MTTYLSQGDGNYTVVNGNYTSNESKNYQAIIHIGDFNGDGLTDFIRQNRENVDNQNFQVGLSDGDGTFTIITPTGSPNNSSAYNYQNSMRYNPGVNLIMGDYNGDGKTDFIRQEKGGYDDNTSNTFSVWLSKGNGQFDIVVPSGGEYQDGMRFDPGVNIIPGDFDGDGKTDFIRQEKGGWDDDATENQYGQNTFSVYFANGDGTFTAREPDESVYRWGLRNDPGVNIITGDFNGDGAMDFMAQAKNDRANSSSGIFNNQPHLQIFLSKGSGTRSDGSFNLIIPSFIPSADTTEFRDDTGTNLITGDFNGDGKTDFIRQEKGDWDNNTYNTFSVYLSNGDGTFTRERPDAPEYQAVLNYDKGANLIVGDFDGDGADDFLRQERGDWGGNDFANSFQTYLSNLDEPQNRYAITQPLDTLAVEALQFEFVAGQEYFDTNPFHFESVNENGNTINSTYGDEDFNLTAGDAPEAGEEVVVSYSVDGGTTWTNLGTLTGNSNWSTLTLTLPTAAQTEHTQFRWQQTNFTDLDDDTWGIDNIQLVRDVSTLFNGVQFVTPTLLNSSDNSSAGDTTTEGGSGNPGFTIAGNGSISLLGETLADVALLVDKNGLKFDLLRRISFGSLGWIDRDLSVRVGANGISVTGELDLEFPLKVKIPLLGTLNLPDFGVDGELSLAVGTDGTLSGTLRDVDFTVWGKNLSIPSISLGTNVTNWDDILEETSKEVSRTIKRRFTQIPFQADEFFSNLGSDAIDFLGDGATFLANWALGGLESLWEGTVASQLYSAYGDQIGDAFDIATDAIQSAINDAIPGSVQKGIKKASRKAKKLFNGPIAGGLVFLDTNGNLILDEGEPATFTDSYGRFDLNYDLATYDTNGDGRLDTTEALVIGVGGIETTTGQVFNSSFLAPVGSEVTPLTTLKTGLILNGFSPEEAEQLIKDSYGIEIGETSLDNFDLYAAIGGQEGDQTALLDMIEGNLLSHLLLLFGSQVIRLYNPELTGLQAQMALLQVVANVATNTGTIAPESYEFNRQLVEQLATPSPSSGNVQPQPLVSASILDEVAQFLSSSKSTIEQTLAGVIGSDQVLEDLFVILPTFNYLKGILLEESPTIVKDILQGHLTLEDAITQLRALFVENNYLLKYELNSDRVISVRSEGTLLEGDTSFHNGQFIVELGEAAPAQGLTIFYNLSGSATHHEDYDLVNGSGEGILQIAPYASSGVIDLELLDDDLEEGIETITINLQYASDGFALAPEGRSAYLLVTDDENPNPTEGIVPTQVITGTINNDELLGGPNSDWLKGSYGDDRLQGNAGSDRLDGGFGADELYGGEGNDSLSGHFGTDRLFGEGGNDTLQGGTEADWLEGGEGSDLLLGQAGDDRLYGQAGNDQLEGGAGDDYLSGGANNDWLQGGLGNDILLGDTGDDLIAGNAGADQFVINDFSGDFDIFTDFDPAEGDRIVILDSAIANFDPTGLNFANGFLKYNDRNLALVQNEGQIYALMSLDQVVDVVSELTFPETAPVGSNSLTTGDLPSLDSLTNNTVDPANAEGLLAEILTRGTLRAAITPDTPDWQKVQAQALAAALFGNANAVEFVTLSEGEILDAVVSQSVDLSAHLFPQTNDPRIDFAPATVYRSDLIVVREDTGIREPRDLAGATIGVVIDTNDRQNLSNVLGSAGISYNLAEFSTPAELLNAYDQGTVSAIVLDNLNLNQRPAGSTVLNLELSVEPLALALPENESAWADVVRWVVQAPTVAEALGITSLNLESLVTSSDPAVQRFLGLTGNLGQSLGIANNFAAQVIRTQGNFEEYWQTYFPGVLRHRNHLSSNNGLLYTLPFSGSAEPDRDVPENNDRNVLADVLARGTVKVGIVANNPGFSVPDGTGNYSGFDVDLGRAIAAALFNDPNAVEWVEQDKLQRFTNAASGVVDISASQATHNLVRDGAYGVDYSQVYLYTGQGILTRKDNGIVNLPSLNGRTVGVIANTTSAQNLSDVLSQYQARVTYQTYADSAALFAAYDRGEVDAVTNDLPLLASAIPNFSNPDEHQLLNAEISQEPLALVVDEDQSDWLDLVNLVLDTLTQAEELGITAANVTQLKNSKNPAIRKFLGINGSLGENLGLRPDFAVNIIKAVGNYGEIYDRHFDLEVLPRTTNLGSTDYGLQYGESFTNALSTAPPALVQRTNGIFQVVDNLANLDFTLLNHDQETIAEVGLFLVDDAQGTIAGLTPDTPDYIAAVLGRSQTLFSVLDDNPTGFSSKDLSRTLGEFPANSYFGLYLVKGSDSETVLSTDQFNRVSLSRNVEALQTAISDNSLNLNWEIDGDGDFADLNLQVTPTLEGTTIGSTLDKTIDLTGFDNSPQELRFTLNREASYDNLVSFYRVNATGEVLNAAGEVISGKPNEDGNYAQIALNNRLDFVLSAANQSTAIFNESLNGGLRYAPILMADAGSADNLDLSKVYFAYQGANGDGVNHVRRMANNVFGFEDLFGGGDNDFNDVIVSVEVV
ncbi:MAG: transporter substrate-binding domain-containing protein [Prochlorotrichaceae cyanobacterium]